MNPVNQAWLVNVDERDFEQQVLKASHDRPVVVDFWAPWCGPCRALTPILEKVIGEHAGKVTLAKVNTDEAPTLAGQFQIQGIPLVIAFRHGKPVAEFEGVRPEPFVRQFVEKLLPSDSEKLAAEAKSLETTDPAQAELTYLQALDRDRQNEVASLGLARIMIGRGQTKEALQVLENLTPSPEVDRMRGIASLKQLAKPLGDITKLQQRMQNEPKNSKARFELGVALAAQEKYSECLEMLLSAAELDPKLASTAVREAMVSVFQIVGPQSALANDYRNKLSTLLY